MLGRCRVTWDGEAKGMRRRMLERKLNRIGWYFKRHGGNHDLWTDGHKTLTIPRHREIEEDVAKAILKDAQSSADRLGQE